MSVDFYAVSSNLAGRFSPWNVTPPSGEGTISFATNALPSQIAQERTVLIFPPGPDEIDFRFASMGRGGTINFPVRFYLFKIRDNKRNVVLCLKWLSSLYAQLDGQVHLGQETTGVQYAVIRSLGVARLSYAAEDFDGISAIAEVHIGEGLNPSS